MDCDAHMEDDEDDASRRSSSSLSSSDWEEVEGIDEPIPGLIREAGSEAGVPGNLHRIVPVLHMLW